MTLIKRTDNWIPSVFDDLFNTDWFEDRRTLSRLGKNIPAVNVKETENSFLVEVAAPGKKKEDFKIELNHNLLSISSETKEEHKSEEKEKFTRREFSYSSFKRSFTLPDSIDNSKIKANYENGVLKIELPKREEAKIETNRLIEID